jgi:hypothetical protein
MVQWVVSAVVGQCLVSSEHPVFWNEHKRAVQEYHVRDWERRQKPKSQLSSSKVTNFNMLDVLDIFLYFHIYSINMVSACTVIYPLSSNSLFPPLSNPIIIILPFFFCDFDYLESMEVSSAFALLLLAYLLRYSILKVYPCYVECVRISFLF